MSSRQKRITNLMKILIFLDSSHGTTPHAARLKEIRQFIIDLTPLPIYYHPKSNTLVTVRLTNHRSLIRSGYIRIGLL